MKQQFIAHPRAIAMLMAAVALPSTPALAQEAATPPPPVTATLPAPAAPTVQPEVVPEAAPAAPASAPAVIATSPAAQPAQIAEVPALERQVPVARRTAVKAAPERSVARKPAVTVPAPVAQAPVADPHPVAAPTAEASPPAPEPVATEKSTPAITDQTTDQRADGAPLPWGMIAAGAALLAALAAYLIFGRRRRGAILDETAYSWAPVSEVEPNAFIAESAPAAAFRHVEPVAVEPVAQTERPWIGLSIQPLRAGGDGEGALVEYELRVENAGDAPARHVRVSSALVGGIGGQPIDGAPEHTVDLEAGAGVTISARLSASGRSIGSNFLPMILAEARYPLPGGGEGHIAARFAIGIPDGEHISPIDLDGKRIREDVAAELDDVLERV